jgi:hypothetical protein
METAIALSDTVYDDTQGRYLSLVALINGTAEDHAPIPYAWIAEAMHAVEPLRP